MVSAQEQEQNKLPRSKYVLYLYFCETRMNYSKKTTRFVSGKPFHFLERISMADKQRCLNKLFFEQMVSGQQDG